MTEVVIGVVKKVQHWTNKLFSITVQAPVCKFIAGQFAKLSLDVEGERIQRAYSYVNAPSSRNLEFYIVKIPHGKLSPRLYDLQTGDILKISKVAAGFFILKEIIDCKILWMIATGTGLGPYLSILQDDKEQLQRFENIVVVHAVRFVNDLSYLSLMQNLEWQYKGKLRIQTVISGEHSLGSLYGRVTTVIENGSLESAVGLNINKKESHVMLCGNPQMVRDSQQILQNTRGMKKNLRRNPGHITSENYW
ncbi:ferredoxin--NADP(+) reductase [Candidatus Profftia sp. (ex Adelges kitamiensis)]|uniref:ferredoxin--NADP(+) reductase n=1 Tax=Candidatus Profftia sp. (ex Adelges kitamiensis) TaxID=2864218 RepID=UPI001CE2414A|nr:ferredoxin--NADP(+) reductase [Candidatus Profftia sp. (ex Adelges kitamiensis)]